MSIEIRTYPLRTSNVYYGGEEVSGFLLVKGPLNIADATVKVTFRGGSEAVQVIRNRELKDKQIFFSTTQVIFEGTLDLQQDNSQTIPFKFTLPETTAAWGQQKIKLSPKKDLYAQEPHLLPPSLALSGGFPHGWSVHILYCLEAEVDGKFAMRELRGRRKITGAIAVVPSPYETKYLLDHADTQSDAVQSKKVTHISSRLLEGNTDKRRSMSTWFSDKFASSSPKAVFSFTARTATTLSAGQDIPIQITLNYDEKASNLPSIPTFTLLELKYKIKAITNLVSRGTLAPDMYIEDHTSVFKRQFRFAQMTLTNGQPVDIGYIDTERGGLRYVALDAALVSPFMSYNVSRRYYAEVEMVFECGGKKMTAKFGWPKIDIVYNESYHSKAGDAPADKDGSLQGAVGVARVLGATALIVATILGGG